MLFNLAINPLEISLFPFNILDKCERDMFAKSAKSVGFKLFISICSLNFFIISSILVVAATKNFIVAATNINLLL